MQRRYIVGIAVAVGAAALATLLLSLATASAQAGPNFTATVPGTTAGPPITTTGTVPTTTATTTGPPTGSPVCHGCGHPRLIPVHIKINYKHPVAGKTFRPFTIRTTGTVGTIRRVECDGEIAGNRLRARHESFFSAPHRRTEVVCAWRMPAGAGGKRLRPWEYYGHSVFVVVWLGPQGGAKERVVPGFTPSWIVKRR
jgi:hypothetical protein